MDHVGACGMSPMHFAPGGRFGIQLIEEVVLALPPDRSVRIVHPVARRHQVEFRTQWIVRDFADAAFGEAHTGPGRHQEAECRSGFQEAAAILLHSEGAFQVSPATITRCAFSENFLAK